MQQSALVIGGTGVVGSAVVEMLRSAGFDTYSVTRRGGPLPQDIACDVTTLDQLDIQHISTVYVTTMIGCLSHAGLSALAQAGAKRIVALSTSSVISKASSNDIQERASAQQTIVDERVFSERCLGLGIAWTILRPTVIYCEGNDQNITRIARMIKRFHFFPLYGSGTGLRQPVHAHDLANGMIAASRSTGAINETFEMPGGETITYSEMVGRIFDGLGKRRRVFHIPTALWKVAFSAAAPFLPNVRMEMVRRMEKDLVYDAAKARSAFGWSPRPFRPQFADR